MFVWILKKIIGTKNDREVKRMRPMVGAINDLEPKMKALSDADLRGKTAEFRQRIANGQKLNDVLVEAFAVVREAGRRVLEMRHFDVQLMGGMVLHRGAIAEMKTGEGKTLVATLPAYLNALSGKGVHIVTVNDYLAKRDAEWMGKIHHALGLEVGVVVHGQNDAEKKVAYRADITYGQNNEFGFDYLRDNMKFSAFDWCQRELNYAIVDEVDSILVDEARTPLIISGPAQESTELYYTVNAIIPSLKKDEHYNVDEKAHSVMLTDEGVEAVQRKLSVENLYDPRNIEYLHIVGQCLKAHTLYKRDVNYMVTDDGHVLIIDEFTGRVLPGRRWSDGLHQAVEAKENVKIQEETVTYATITFQNLFRIYRKLAGMTGTAETEAEEFHKIYKLDIVAIPTNRTLIRREYEDVVYKTEKEKFKAIVDEILDCHERGQPVLVGTTSVEKSEAIARILQRKQIAHEVLNAKQHEREAYVVAQAGRKGAITVSTNMAGRGTDILLGGNPEMLARTELGPRPAETSPEDYEQKLHEMTARHKASAEAEKKEVIAAGGLHILGTERHESRRIDNQLRGRSGRQGDPGSSRFFLSLEDDLMRIFAADRISRLMDTLGMEEGVPIEHRWVTRAVENAQKKVEARNFDIRKNLLEYDDVMNQQRKTIYSLRRQVLEGRYYQEPSEEDQKAKKKAAQKADAGAGAGVPKKDAGPAPAGARKVDAHLADRARPVLEAMVRRFAVWGPSGPPAGRDGDPTGIRIEQIPRVDADKIEREVYAYFGVRTELADLAGDAPGLLKRAAREVAHALTEQHERLLDLADVMVGGIVDDFAPERVHPEEWDRKAIADVVQKTFGVRLPETGKIIDRQELATTIYGALEKHLQQREAAMTPELLLRIFRHLYLEEIDRAWVEHLQNMESLRDGIGLRGYGQKDPKQEYKKEAFGLFLEMMTNIQNNVAEKLFHVRIESEQDASRLPARRERHMTEGRGAELPAGDDGSGTAVSRAAQASQAGGKAETVRRAGPKVGRNDPCPCGSGKKYKKCHGAGAAAQP